MIKTTIKDIYNARGILQKLSAQRLPVKVSYGIAKVVTAANVELAIYDEQRIKLCEKYGKLNEDGTLYDIVDKESFNKELNELINLDVELNAKTIRLTDDIKLSAQELIVLDGFVEVIEDD